MSVTPRRVTGDARRWKALSHPLRQEILRHLGEHEAATSTTIAEALGQNTGTTSYHLRILAYAGIIEEIPGRARGRERWWRTIPADHREPDYDTLSPEDRAALDQWRAGQSPAEVVQLARPRPGHFDLGTGYHGDLWLDLDALLLRPARLRPYLRYLSEQLSEHEADAVCGPLEGGAFLAYAVADLLGVAFLAGYREAGGYRLPQVTGGIAGWRVAVVDDALNAGTAVTACLAEARHRGAVPVAAAALLALGPARAAMPLPFYAAATVPSQAWPAADCPLCAAGTPFTSDP